MRIKGRDRVTRIPLVLLLELGLLLCGCHRLSSPTVPGGNRNTTHWTNDLFSVVLPAGWNAAPTSVQTVASDPQLAPRWEFSVRDAGLRDVAAISIMRGGPGFTPCLCAPEKMFTFTQPSDGVSRRELRTKSGLRCQKLSRQGWRLCVHVAPSCAMDPRVPLLIDSLVPRPGSASIPERLTTEDMPATQIPGPGAVTRNVLQGVTLEAHDWRGAQLSEVVAWVNASIAREAPSVGHRVRLDLTPPAVLVHGDAMPYADKAFALVLRYLRKHALTPSEEDLRPMPVAFGPLSVTEFMSVIGSVQDGVVSIEYDEMGATIGPPSATLECRLYRLPRRLSDLAAGRVEYFHLDPCAAVFVADGTALLKVDSAAGHIRFRQLLRLF